MKLFKHFRVLLILLFALYAYPHNALAAAPGPVEIPCGVIPFVDSHPEWNYYLCESKDQLEKPGLNGPIKFTYTVKLTSDPVGFVLPVTTLDELKLITVFGTVDIHVDNLPAGEKFKIWIDGLGEQTVTTDKNGNASISNKELMKTIIYSVEESFTLHIAQLLPPNNEVDERTKGTINFMVKKTEVSTELPKLSCEGLVKLVDAANGTDKLNETTTKIKATGSFKPPLKRKDASFYVDLRNGKGGIFTGQFPTITLNADGTFSFETILEATFITTNNPYTMTFRTDAVAEGSLDLRGPYTACEETFQITITGERPTPTLTPVPTVIDPPICGTPGAGGCDLNQCYSSKCKTVCSYCRNIAASGVPNLTTLCQSIGLGTGDRNNPSECEKCTDPYIQSDKKGIWTAIGCIPTKPFDIINKYVLATAGFGIAGGIAFLYFLYGAFQILTSMGNAEKINHGKEIMTSSISGLLLIIFSVLILQIIGYDILRIPGFSKCQNENCTDFKNIW